MTLAIVTGSADRLGGHVAARLAEAGYDVALHASTDKPAADWLARRIERAGKAVRLFAADLSDAVQADTLVGRVGDAFGEPVTLLVNNASQFAATEEGGPDMTALVAHFRVNAAAPFALARALADQAGEKGAAVVNTLDQRIAHPHGDQQAYSLSKQSLAEVTRLLARTLAPRVRVNAVAPGLVLPSEDYNPHQIDRLTRMMPLERLPDPDAVADAVLYLASARATTGQTLFVDGGASLVSWPRDFVYLAR